MASLNPTATRLDKENSLMPIRLAKTAAAAIFTFSLGATAVRAVETAAQAGGSVPTENACEPEMAAAAATYQIPLGVLYAVGLTETGATTRETPTPAANTTNPAAGKQGPPAGLLTELFALMNADRAAHDLAPLSWDDRLAVTAQQVSDAMAESETVAPKDLRAILALGYTRAGENVVTTPYAATAVSVEYGWMGSASPRATILDSGSQYVGIGVTSSTDGRVWISADFGG